MEWMDIYDLRGNLTGKIAKRGMILPKDTFFLCTHVILENMDGMFLIQKRSVFKSTRPGEWDITAGAVDAGETSLDGAIRETREEVGLDLPRQKMQFLFRDCRKSCFHDVWYVRIPFSLQDCTMQESEVAELKLVTAKELSELVKKMPHRSEHYKQSLTAFLDNKIKM